jgi:hypothetical protein
LAARNQKIKNQLNNLIDKERNLENLLLYAIKNFAPNFFLKGNELKYLENLLPDNSKDSQFIEVSNIIYINNLEINLPKK